MDTLAYFIILGLASYFTLKKMSEYRDLQKRITDLEKSLKKNAHLD